ncbi:MAG: TonB-dependent receptor [Pseudomonadota bacterium]
MKILHSGAALAALATAFHASVLAQTSENDTDDADVVLEVEDEIIVRGRARRLYRSGESPTGKLPTNPLDSTQIITTINEQLIQDQGARDAQDIYRNIAGVSLFSYAGVTARGFRQEEIFFDGLRGDPYVGFNVPQLFNVERVDFLKGPAGMLYGQGEPGGLFNFVTKKPSQDFSAELRGIYGTEARLGGSFEITGALPIEGASARAGVFIEDRNTPRENTSSYVAIYDLGLRFEMPFADLMLQGTRYEQDLDGNRLRGVPVDDEGNFLTDRRWNHNEATDFLDLRSNNFQAGLKGDIGAEINWDATFRYTDASQEQQYHEPRALIDSDGDGELDLVGREFRDQLRTEEQYTFGTNVTWTKDFGAIQNRLLVGYEYFNGDFIGVFGGTRFNSNFVTRFLAGDSLPSDIIPLRLDVPNYGQTQPQNYAVLTGAPSVTNTELHGVYGLNELTIGRFTVVGGVRYDDNTTEADGSTDADTNVSFRVGGIYKPAETVSLFAQFADSYTPQGAGAQAPEVGGPFDPVTGTIVEGGVKAELFDGRLYGSVSVYNIIRDGILQETGDVSPGGRDILAPIGEVTSTGVEMELFADITPDWVLTAAYAYNDTRITETNGDGSAFRNLPQNGDRFANAPEHQFGFWTRYQVPAINTAFAVGGDYVGERVNLNGRTVQSYFIADASIIWELDGYNVLLRVENIFDKTYAESGFLNRTGHFPGDPRSVFVEFTKKW